MKNSLEKRILLPEDLQPINFLSEYKARGGLKGLERARSLSSDEIIAEVKKAGLRGRGGAGFPAAIKWTTVREDPCEIKYVVCNGSEGEPGTYKDRYVLQRNPYQLIEGLLIAAQAIGARKIIIGLKAKFTREMARLEGAIEEYAKEGLVDASYIEIVPGPDEYLFGEEKALLEVIDGRPAMPRHMPPFMQGARYTPNENCPTVVNNVETMCHVSHIMAKGADWFRQTGSDDTPGTMVFTLCGDVKRPGMYELPLGTTLRQLIYECGEGPAGEYPIQAVFSGVANPVMTDEIFDTPMGFGTLRQAGGGLGSAGFIVYDQSMSMVKVAYMFSKFLAEESCGQCFPCKGGCGTITRYLQKIVEGEGTVEDIDTILFESIKITNQTRCFLPTEEQILIPSIIRKFREEFEQYIREPDLHGREPKLPLINYFAEDSRVFTYAPPKTGMFIAG